MRTRRLFVLLVLTTVAAGCGTQGGPGPASPSSSESSPQLRVDERHAVDALAPGAAGDPSGFEWGDQIFHFLTEEGRVVDEQPWTACLGNSCWDGGPGLSGPIPSVGSPDALYFAFDYPGWTFDRVSFNPVDDQCGGRSTTVRATPVTDRIFRVDPVGLRGEWRVDVSGRFPAGGDAVTSVRWTTPGDGSTPEPGATGSLCTDQDGKRVAPYGGPELHLTDWARTPAGAAGSWTVAAVPDPPSPSPCVARSHDVSEMEQCPSGAVGSPQPSWTAVGRVSDLHRGGVPRRQDLHRDSTVAAGRDHRGGGPAASSVIVPDWFGTAGWAPSPCDVGSALC